MRSTPSSRTLRVQRKDHSPKTATDAQALVAEYLKTNPDWHSADAVIKAFKGELRAGMIMATLAALASSGVAQRTKGPATKDGYCPSVFRIAQAGSTK